MRAVVSNLVGSEKLEFNAVRDRILAEEVRKIDFYETPSSALNVETRGKGHDRNSNRNKGRSKSNYGRDQSKYGRTVKCWNCGKHGHIKRNCRAPKKKKDEDKEDEANAITEDIPDAFLLPVDSLIDSWVLNLGASFHPTAHREIMENYVAVNHRKIYLADGEHWYIVGLRDIRLKMSKVHIWKICKMRRVPKLMQNLISGGQLNGEGHSVTFSDGAWKVTKGAMVVARGHKTGTLYMTSSCKDMIGVADNIEKSEL